MLIRRCIQQCRLQPWFSFSGWKLAFPLLVAPRTPVVYFCIYDLLKSHVRRHLLKQVLVYSGAGHVHVEEDQPNGVGDVQLPGLGAHGRRSYPLEFEKQVKIVFREPKPSTPTTFLLPPNAVLGLQTGRPTPLQGDVQYGFTYPELWRQRSIKTPGTPTKYGWNSANPNTPNTPPIFLQHHVAHLF